MDGQFDDFLEKGVERANPQKFGSRLFITFGLKDIIVDFYVHYDEEAHSVLQEIFIKFRLKLNMISKDCESVAVREEPKEQQLEKQQQVSKVEESPSSPAKEEKHAGIREEASSNNEQARTPDDEESRAPAKSEKENEDQEDKDDQDEVKLHTRDNSPRSSSNSIERKQPFPNKELEEDEEAEDKLIEEK